MAKAPRSKGSKGAKTKAGSTAKSKEVEAVEKAIDAKAAGRPTISDLMQSETVKAHASIFVKTNEGILDDEEKKKIASWAFRVGMASILKSAEFALGNFGAGTIFGTLSSIDYKEIVSTSTPQELEPRQPANVESKDGTSDPAKSRRRSSDPMFA